MKRSLLIVTLVCLASLFLFSASFGEYLFEVYLEAEEDAVDYPTMSNTGTDCRSTIDTNDLSGPTGVVYAGTIVSVASQSYEEDHWVFEYDVSSYQIFYGIPWDTGTTQSNKIYHYLGGDQQTGPFGEAYFKFRDPNN